MLPTLDAGSIDAVVCDPPYELGFMGKKWDSTGVAVDPATWREVLRVLKPGGYLLAFGGTRTYHRMTVAIEDAGFEIRDCLSWQYGCLSDDSEALTRRGWVRGPELRDTDDVLQWDATTGAFAWARPSRIVVAPYTGPLVRLANRHTDQLLTPNHRVYARVQRHTRHAPATDYEVLDAEAVGSRSSAWRVTLPCAGTLTEGAHVDPAYAYLVGWWLTDAWAHGDGKACMFSQSKRDTLPKLRAALAPYAPSEYVKPGKKDAHADEHTFYLTGPIAAQLLTEHRDRRLTWDVLGWSLPARQALYRGLMDGDGSQPGAQYAHTFWSKDAARRDVFLALATTLGFRSFIGDKDCVFVNTETATTEVQGKHRVAPVEYDGLVWCVTVPAGAFLARRNGRPFVTGNSGFPKSLDVSKAIDKAAGAERAYTGKVTSVTGRRVAPSSAVKRDTGMGREDAQTNFETMPATEAAERWEGWGTALKPAWEPIVVARAPFAGTVAANVLKYGTGALNIDACRVQGGGEVHAVQSDPGNRAGTVGTDLGFTKNDAEAFRKAQRESIARTNTLGRWPANLILTHAPGCGDECAPGCPVAALDSQTANLQPSKGGYVRKHGADQFLGSGLGDGRTDTPTGVIDAGGASRFFNNLPVEADDLVPFLYTPKASRSEREEGCGDLPARSGAEAVDRAEGSAGLTPRAGAGRSATEVRNPHPTVKPVAVMRWLVRLVTPPGGWVLDPFMGSGTTGIAAVKEGMRFVGIEMSEEYLAIARARIEAAQGGGFAKTAPPPLAVFYPTPPATGLTNGNVEAMKSAQSEPCKEAPVMYVKSIESNVKKGAKTELGRLTLIVGPNGGGKSSIVNGVELALTGRASDVVGRAEVAKGIDLLTLAPAGDDALWANVRLSDGREASWRCERNTRTGGAREATHSLPNGVKVTFPVRAVREALAGAPATVRAWLVGRIGSTVSEEAIRGLIPEDLHAPYADLIKPLFGYPAQVLLDAREAAAKQARNAGTDAKAANALAEQTGANLAGEPSDEDVEAARHRVREAAVAASAGSAPRPARLNLAALRAQAEVKIKLYADFDAEATRLQGILDTTPAVNADVVRIRDALTRVLVFTAQKDAADCLVCNSAVPHGAHAAMLQRAETLTRAAQGDVVAVEAQARLGLVQTALADAQGRAEEAVRGFREAEAEDARIAALPEAAASQGDALAALRAAEEQVRALEGARAAWSNVRAAKARARDLSARQRVYADLHTAIEDAIVGVLERARSGFAKKVQSYLPAEDAFDLVLDDNGKDVCKFGFTRDGVLHTALSGAEWARLTLALAAAVTSDEEADLAVLTPEDRAFDPETLASVMRALGNAPGQVLLCSPVAPAGRTPKGWTIIDLTAPKVPKGGKKADEAATFDSIGEAK